MFKCFAVWLYLSYHYWGNIVGFYGLGKSLRQKRNVPFNLVSFERISCTLRILFSLNVSFVSRAL